MHVDGVLVASCKRYERELRMRRDDAARGGHRRGVHAPALRGRGYATAMLGALLDAERAAGTDLAFLFSDIHPAFYERLGFVALPSRLLALRASSLPSERIDSQTVADADWAGVRRCFEAQERRARVGAPAHAAGVGVDAAARGIARRTPTRNSSTSRAAAAVRSSRT